MKFDVDEIKQLLAELKQLDYLNFKGWEIPAPYDMRLIIDFNDPENGINTLTVLPSRIYQKSIILKQYEKLIVLHNWDTDGFKYTKSHGTPRRIIFKNETDPSWEINTVTPNKLKDNQFFLINKILAIPLTELDPSFDKLPQQEKVDILAEREKQTIANCLQIFIKNNLIPVFDNYKIVPFYEVLLNILPKLKTELSRLEAKINQLINIKNQQGKLLSSTFNYRKLLDFQHFDCQAIDNSVIRFTDATLEWCQLLEEKTTEYQLRQHKLISEGNNLTAELFQKYKTDPHLNQAENKHLETRKTFLFERLSLNMNIPMANLAGMKIQCQQLKKRLFDINSHENGLIELGRLAAEPRPSFDLVAENSANMLTDMLKKMEFYETNRELVNALIYQEHAWRKEYASIKITARKNLKNECEQDDIEKSIWALWIAEWAEKRWVIEQCLHPLIEKELQSAFQASSGTNKPLVLQLIELLNKYKNKLDHFYLQDRKAIYQKFAFQANSDLQEKFEVESELYKLTLLFQQGLHEIIFSLSKIDERLWLFQWSDVLVDMTIETILGFIRDKALDGISKTVINDFSQLKLQNYATFIHDAKASAEMMGEWDKDYNSLMFKMQKEFQNQSNKNSTAQQTPNVKRADTNPYKINFERKRETS